MVVKLMNPVAPQKTGVDPGKGGGPRGHGELVKNYRDAQEKDECRRRGLNDGLAVRTLRSTLGCS
jgi:hypothetical protein